METYDLEKIKSTTAKNVLKPPFHTAGPMSRRVTRARSEWKEYKKSQPAIQVRELLFCNKTNNYITEGSTQESVTKQLNFSTSSENLYKSELRQGLTHPRASYRHKHVSYVRSIIHRQTNRQHKEHGGHYIDCQVPEIHCPHDVNLLRYSKCTDR